MQAHEVRALIEAASEETVLVRTVELDLRGHRVPVQLVTPDLLTLQDLLDEVRADAGQSDAARDFNGRYLLKLVPRIAYANFDVDQMDGELIFPGGDRDPVYRRLTRHPTAFAALTVAAAEVVRPLQMVNPREPGQAVVSPGERHAGSSRGGPGSARGQEPGMPQEMMSLTEPAPSPAPSTRRRA